MINNPKWEFDEITLALELYLKSRPTPPGPEDPGIRNLSFLLRSIHYSKHQSVSKTCRNPNGVAMKLQNLRSLDPKFDGKGLSKRSALEREVWDKFSKDPKKLRAICAKIRDNMENKIFF